MSAAGRPHEDAPGHAAAAVHEAGFVRLVGTADGDALAATGLLARALAAVDTPYQASLAAVPGAPATDADCVVAVGHDHAGADVALVETPLAVAAADVADDLAQDAVDPTLALAGGVCAGAAPAGRLLEAAGLQRQPGVAVPTADPAEGLAASTLVHAGFSGEEETAAALVEGVQTPGGRTLASAVAMAAVEDAVPRAAESVRRALRPYVTDRFETLGGYADVLSALATDRPGLGIALALGGDVEPDALSVWCEHGHRAHEALRLADTGRYDGFTVARVDADAPVSTVARLQFGYRSAEPVALALADGRAAVVAADGTAVATPFREAAAALNGRASARDGRGAATFDGTANDYLDAFREAR